MVGLDVIRFPRSGIVDGAEGPSVVHAITDQFTSLVAASAPLTRLEFRLHDGTAAHTRTLSEGPAFNAIRRQDLRLAQHSRYPHIRILSAAEQSTIPAEYTSKVGPLVDPTPELLRELDAAVQRATPTVVGASSPKADSFSSSP